MPDMAVYAAFDSSGECLYVGETFLPHPVLRWAQHYRQSPHWVMEATRWEVLPDYSERQAALRLKPKHNVMCMTIDRPRPEGSTEHDVMERPLL